ncbi:hypothetical protein MBLL_03463 [Methylobacterium bullatum]|uniref:Uncharacterized protein n=1 Tax=Methylobacterium bullatum TaxID=570505 RepID=A0A679K8R5_9HYPH|nr:hypothetical protein MBLL_03463 [Methylobacterium bullatum]
MSLKSLLRCAVFTLASVCTALPTVVQAEDGPFAVTTGSYRFAGRDEPLVATDRKVDLWAEVYRPTKLSGGPLPVAVFLHGNHGTCGKFDKELQVRVDSGATYTDTGKCGAGEVVVPNHLGYEYLAKQLASWGYIVVSINANRGITAGIGDEGDWGLNLMRGRLILRHLALLSDWNSGVGKIPVPETLKFKPLGTMDLSQVGLMGHSRGGEGARAAIQQFRDAASPYPALIRGLSIKSVFEIGPVDGQTDRVLDADGVNSMILLPACDGDVLNLQGLKVFDRTFLTRKPDASKTFHGTVYVWGANHNAYNTEWQTSDSPGCSGTDALFQPAGRSKPQQLTAVQTLIPFFRATVGAKADPSLAAQFDPANSLPSPLLDITNVDRGYLPAPVGDAVQKLETFSQQTGKSDTGIPTTSRGVEVVHQRPGSTEWWFEHEPEARVATVSWTANSNLSKMFQVNFSPAKDMSAFKTLSFRTTLRCFGEICDFPASADGEFAYGVRLLDGNGQASRTYLTSRDVRISRPVGMSDTLHPILYTVQVPLSALSGVDLSQITALRFTFHDQKIGTVDIGDVMLLKSDPAPAQAIAQSSAKSPTAWMAAAKVQAISMPPHDPAADANTMTIVRKPSSARAISAGASRSAPMVDIVVTSKRPFPFTNAFPRFKVGNKTIPGGTIGPDGKTMTISIPEATFNELPTGADVSLSLLASAPPWKFGPLKK